VYIGRLKRPRRSVYKGVDNLFARIVGFQAGLRRVGDVVGPVNQHVVPRLVTVGLTSIVEVPVIVGLTRQIESDHHTTIAISDVPHELARNKARFGARFVLG
jgi:hypothetical protein|tara:strand:+ start:1114 stop:1419 length:306 start_codon:yes stop_codon:yes gene_type:complete